MCVNNLYSGFLINKRYYRISETCIEVIYFTEACRWNGDRPPNTNTNIGIASDRDPL